MTKPTIRAMTRRHPGGRPPLPPEVKRRGVYFKLAPATLVQLERIAETLGESRTAVVERLILEEGMRRRPTRQAVRAALLDLLDAVKRSAASPRAMG